ARLAARARQHPAAPRAARSASWRRPRPRPRSAPSPARAPARTGDVGVPAAPPGSVGCSPVRPYPTGRVGARDPHILGVRVYGVRAMSDAHLFAVGIVLAWLAGVRAYLTVFGVGVAGYLGWLDLPPALEATTSPWVLGVSCLLALTEFFADKIPGVDSGGHFVQTPAREPALAIPPPDAPSPTGAPPARLSATGASDT